jgi:hypothetical protein
MQQPKALKVVGFEAGLFGDAGEHFGADLDSFVEGEPTSLSLGKPR